MSVPFHHVLFLVAFVFGFASGQSPPLPPKITPNLTIDSGIEHSYEETVSYANAAIEIAMNANRPQANGALIFNDDFGTSTFYSQIAEYDVLIKNNTYQHFLQVQLPLVVGDAVSKPITAINNYLVYGYAAARAYVAYHDDGFLTIAQQLWNFGRTYCISAENIASKQIATKSSSLRTECNKKSLLGGVFLSTNSSDGELGSQPTVAFFTLSALLAEITSNTTYLQAANETIQYLKNFAYFPRANSPEYERFIHALDTDQPNCVDINYQVWFPVTGNIIEGLSVLASIHWDDAGTQSLLQDAISSSTVEREVLQSNGVFKEFMPPNSPADDPYLVRGLATAYRRNQIDSGMREYIKALINIQYNYLLDNSTLTESNVYVDRNNVSPQKRLNMLNQTIYSMVYIHAIGSVNGTSSSSNPPHPNTPSDHTQPTTRTKKTGEIVGGVLGGVLFFVLLSGLVVYIQRRKKSKGPSMFLASPYNPPESTEIEDSLMKSPTSPRKGIQSMLEARNSRTSPISTAPPQSRIKTQMDPPSQEPTSVASAEEDPNITPYMNATSPNGDPHARYHAISTAELAGILNARLQAEAFHDDMPPSYPQSRVGI